MQYRKFLLGVVVPVTIMLTLTKLGDSADGSAQSLIRVMAWVVAALVLVGFTDWVIALLKSAER